MNSTQSSVVVIDGSNAILGRMASYAVKQTLLGKSVHIVNCEKVVITGNRKNILSRYREIRAKGGSSQRGPYFPTKPAAIVKRTVRGMLSHKEGRGEAAFSRIRCHEGIPAELASIKPLNYAVVDNVPFITLSDLSEELR